MKRGLMGTFLSYVCREKEQTHYDFFFFLVLEATYFSSVWCSEDVERVGMVKFKVGGKSSSKWILLEPPVLDWSVLLCCRTNGRDASARPSTQHATPNGWPTSHGFPWNDAPWWDASPSRGWFILRQLSQKQTQTAQSHLGNGTLHQSFFLNRCEWMQSWLLFKLLMLKEMTFLLLAHCYSGVHTHWDSCSQWQSSGLPSTQNHW